MKQHISWLDIPKFILHSGQVGCGSKEAIFQTVAVQAALSQRLPPGGSTVALAETEGAQEGRPRSCVSSQCCSSQNSSP